MAFDPMSRRDFLKYSAVAAAVGAAAPKALLGADQPAAAPVAEPGQLEYRTLGKTGIKVTTVSLGCMVAPRAVVAKALDLGINWFDTAHGYKVNQEPSEVAVGEVVKEKRDKVNICTKIGGASTDQMLANLEISLKRLQTDRVELLLLHGAGNREAVFNENYLAALNKAKQQGKARFIGVSTHGNMVDVINAVVESKQYDAILTTYNFTQGPELKAAIDKAAAAGIGVIAMKTQAKASPQAPAPGNGLNAEQAKLRWALDTADIACAVPGTRDLTQLDQNFGTMGKKLAWMDRRRMELFAEANAAAACTGCHGCDGTCPRGVEIADVRRCGMYLHGYQDEGLARENYGRLQANAAACGDCDQCTARCVRGATLQPILSDVHRRLA